MEPLEILSIVVGLAAALSSSGLTLRLSKLFEKKKYEKEINSRASVRNELASAKLMLAEGKSAEAEQMIRQAISEFDNLYPAEAVDAPVESSPGKQIAP